MLQRVSERRLAEAIPARLAVIDEHEVLAGLSCCAVVFAPLAEPFTRACAILRVPRSRLRRVSSGRCRAAVSSDLRTCPTVPRQ
eukprot:6826403-Prymnesium_polylepis.1